jgi:hypothetical protein
MIKIIKYKNKSYKNKSNKFKKRKSVKKTKKYMKVYKCKRGGSATLSEDSSPENYRDNYENNISNIK